MRNPVYEIKFRLANAETLTCLEAAKTSGEALRNILSVWQPPSRILSVEIEQRDFFQIHL